MRVLMVSKACVVGAYQKKLEELARLPEVSLTVVVPPSWRDPSGTLLLERRHTQGYDLVVLPCAFNGSYHLHFYPGLGRLMRRLRPDLVHLDEEPYNLATAHGLSLARRSGARTLFFSWQNIRREYPFPFSMMERAVLRSADAGIVGNQESLEVWRAKGYAGPLTVIPQFGVDPDIYAPPAGGIPRQPDRELVIGFVGRMVPEKGVDVLLEALAGWTRPWRAILAGGGPARLETERQVQRLGLAGRVEFRGTMPSSQMPAFYSSLDILVLPSRTRPNWKEQFGRALIEAMACGVVVIGSDSGEIPNVIGDAGLVFPEGQAAHLRALLEQLAADAGLYAELVERGRRRVLAHYTQAAIAGRTYQAYSAVLKRA